MAICKMERYPQQTTALGSRVQVQFFYDLGNPSIGTIVRADGDVPFRTIIRLDDGRHVDSSECRYHYI